MFERFLKILSCDCHVEKGQRILVCCSGGIDSMVLLSLLEMASREMDLRLAVVHVDHGLRGAAARQDAAFVMETCRGKGIDAWTYTLDMDPKTPNMEERARQLRYAKIRECVIAHGFRFFATGHMMDDQAETVIYRLVRGTGLKGMGAMGFVGADGLIRPLLGFTRQEIVAFADQRCIDYVVDHTNEDIKYARNRIRHEILPLMKRINPQATGAIVRLAAIARQETDLVYSLAQRLRKECIQYDWGIVRVFDFKGLNMERLNMENRDMQARDMESPNRPRQNMLVPGKDMVHPAVIRRFIMDEVSEMTGEPRGIGFSQVEAIMEVLSGRKKAHSIGRRVRVALEGSFLVFSTMAKRPYYRVEINGPGVYDLPLGGQGITISGPGDIQGEVRSLLPGDRIKGKRLVKLLCDVPGVLRPFWPVLDAQGQVIGAPGIKGTGIDIEMRHAG
ncbi:MAG: tRNA lysidine(34) synthetase TilS [Thermodesulfobacteriota bacterium]|nr:tRNA lysidine(34) synthetase TilS [Thermodesulfobacteriota bacterium]